MSDAEASGRGPDAALAPSLSCRSAGNAGGTAVPSLDSVILTAGQVGPGYERATIPEVGSSKGQVTLDFCGGGYASEALRSRRFQAVYARKGSDLLLSNEVVRYAPGGAKKALLEVSKRVRNCPKTPVASGSEAGVQGDTSRSPSSTTRGLLGGSVAVTSTIEYSYKGKKKRDSIVVIYQRHGDYLSGVYAYGGTPTQRVTVALKAARASGDNLLLTDHLVA